MLASLHVGTALSLVEIPKGPNTTMSRSINTLGRSVSGTVATWRTIYQTNAILAKLNRIGRALFG
jgi:hypothetical protein